MSEGTSVPTGWCTAQLGQVLTVRGGFAFKSTDYSTAGVPLVRQTELKNKVVDIRGAKHLPSSFLNEYQQYVIRRGDILIGLSGSIGSVSRYQYEEPALQNQRTGVLQLTDSIIDRFAALVMRRLESAIVRRGKGVGVQNVSPKEIERESFPLPPLREQIRIADKLDELESALDAGVAALERAKANLKRYRATVLKAAVEGKLTEQWRTEHPDVEPASKLLERILAERRSKWEAEQQAKFAAAGKQPPQNWKAKYVEPKPPDTSDLPELPRGWCWASVEQLNTAHRPISYGVLQPGIEYDNGVRLVRVCDVADGEVALHQLKRIDPAISHRFQRTILEGGEVLLTIVGTIGRTAVASEMLAGANTARAVAVIQLVSGCLPRFFELVLRTLRTKLTMAAHEVARKTLNLEDVRPMQIALAPLAEQSMVVELTSERLSQVDLAEAAIEGALLRAARLRQSILKRAFEGKLVPQDPNDEPASVLLEHIKATTTAEVERKPSKNGKPTTSTLKRLKQRTAKRG